MMMKLDSKSLSKIIENLPTKDFSHILDLACGTGSFASLYQGNFLSLTGVDISKKMIEKAEEKERYTRLIHQDIFSFLKEDTHQYSLIVAADVVPYLPNLAPIIQQISQRLEKGGLFVLTVETDESLKEEKLFETGRILYPSSLITRYLTENSFVILKEEAFSLRKENISFANGKLFIAQKEN